MKRTEEENLYTVESLDRVLADGELGQDRTTVCAGIFPNQVSMKEVEVHEVRSSSSSSSQRRIRPHNGEKPHSAATNFNLTKHLLLYFFKWISPILSAVFLSLFLEKTEGYTIFRRTVLLQQGLSPERCCITKISRLDDYRKDTFETHHHHHHHHRHHHYHHHHPHHHHHHHSPTMIIHDGIFLQVASSRAGNALAR